MQLFTKRAVTHLTIPALVHEVNSTKSNLSATLPMKKGLFARVTLKELPVPSAVPFSVILNQLLFHSNISNLYHCSISLYFANKIESLEDDFSLSIGSTGERLINQQPHLAYPDCDSDRELTLPNHFIFRTQVAETLTAASN